ATAGGLPAEPATAAERPLGNNAHFASALGNQPLANPENVPECPEIAVGTVKAWYLRSLGRDLLRDNGVQRRMRWCGSRIGAKTRSVEVFARPDRSYGRVGGVCVCGQSLCCPV